MAPAQIPAGASTHWAVPLGLGAARSFARKPGSGSCAETAPLARECFHDRRALRPDDSSWRRLDDTGPRARDDRNATKRVAHVAAGAVIGNRSVHFRFEPTAARSSSDIDSALAATMGK